MASRPLRIGTRGSPMALRQTAIVRDRLTAAHPELAEMGAGGSPEEHEGYDCAIIGGGPAGLSAAIYMGRMRRSVVVLDDKAGRSTWHQVNRNYLGFPRGLSGGELTFRAWEQAGPR